MSKVFILLYFVFSSIAVMGQEEAWSIQQCLEKGLQNNRELQIEKLSVTKAQKNYFHPLETLLPWVNVVADHSYNFGSTIDPATNGRVSSNIQYDNFYVSTGVDLVNFKNIAQSKQDKIAIALAGANAQVVAYEYTLELVSKFFDALYTQELLTIQEQQLQNTKQSLDRVEKEYSLGKRPKSDVYDMQLSYTQELTNLKQTAQLCQLQKLQLCNLMNIPLPENGIHLLSVAEHNFMTGTYVNPTVRQAELAYKATQKGEAVARAVMLPSINGYYTFSTFYYRAINSNIEQVTNSFESQIDYNKNHQVGVRLTIPVFNGFKNSRAVKVAKINTKQQQIAAENVKNKVAQQLLEEVTKQEQYANMQKTLATAVGYANQSFSTSQAKFESNKIEAVTFNAVKNQLLTAKYNVVKNTLQLQFTVLKIAIIKGQNF